MQSKASGQDDANHAGQQDPNDEIQHFSRLVIYSTEGQEQPILHTRTLPRAFSHPAFSAPRMTRRLIQLEAN